MGRINVGSGGSNFFNKPPSKTLDGVYKGKVSHLQDGEFIVGKSEDDEYFYAYGSQGNALTTYSTNLENKTPLRTITSPVSNLRRLYFYNDLFYAVSWYDTRAVTVTAFKKSGEIVYSEECLPHIWGANYKYIMDATFHNGKLYLAFLGVFHSGHTRPSSLTFNSNGLTSNSQPSGYKATNNSGNVEASRYSAFYLKNESYPYLVLKTPEKIIIESGTKTFDKINCMIRQGTKIIPFLPGEFYPEGHPHHMQNEYYMDNLIQFYNHKYFIPFDRSGSVILIVNQDNPYEKKAVFFPTATINPNYRNFLEHQGIDNHAIIVEKKNLILMHQNFLYF